MAEEEVTTLEVNGTSYEVVYVEKRIEMIEGAIGGSFAAAFSGTPTLRQTKTALAYGLREDGQSGWVNATKAIEIAGQYLEEQGYMATMELVANAAMRDCGFLFR